MDHSGLKLDKALSSEICDFVRGVKSKPSSGFKPSAEAESLFQQILKKNFGADAKGQVVFESEWMKCVGVPMQT